MLFLWDSIQVPPPIKGLAVSVLPFQLSLGRRVPTFSTIRYFFGAARAKADRVGSLDLSGVPSGLLLFHHDRHGPICRQPYLLSFDIRDEYQIDKMMMAFVSSFAAVGLGEPDPAVLNTIDSSNMNAMRSNHSILGFIFWLLLILFLLRLTNEGMKAAAETTT